MKTIGEVSKAFGVSIRMLRHWDAIGLLPPAAVTEAGYRLYDEASLGRLQAILLFRELEFPLAEIKGILDAPAFDPKEALRDRIRLMELRKERLSQLIEIARDMLKEETDMSEIGNKDYEQYRAEAREKWGDTAAWREYEQRPGGNEADKAALLTVHFARFGALRAEGADPAGREAHAAVAELKAIITANFYTCTDEILAGLGEMYVGDERFKANIDAAGGDGTAAFVRDAIRSMPKTKSKSDK
jgi:Predicted transcriptional regulators